MDVKRFIFRHFKSHGLALSADASKALESVIARDDDRDSVMNNVLVLLKEKIEKQECLQLHNYIDTIQSIVADLSTGEEDLVLETIQLIDAFSSPKLTFDGNQKIYKLNPAASPVDILGTVQDRANMYKERLMMGRQRLMRSGKFSIKGMGDPVSGSKSNEFGHELSTIESMLGSTCSHILFGILVQPEEGSWQLEDLSGIIQLDLTHAGTAPAAFFTEGSLAIVQGSLISSVFCVQAMALPPAESRDVSLAALNLLDSFGSCRRQQQMDDMRALERASDHAVMVVLSDVMLDRPMVLEKLQEVFRGFEQNGIDPFFVLIGSFVSKPVVRSSGGKGLYKSLMTALSEAILSCPRLSQNAKFLLLPGPCDPGSSVSLPRRRIPAQFVQSLEQRISHIAFGSNPFRVSYFTQEIVFFREELLKKMQRHAVTTSTTTGLSPLGFASAPSSSTGSEQPDVTEKLVQSLLDQAHLCPLPAQARPVVWNLDHTLRLFPLPHLLVLADSSDHFHYDRSSCSAINPGSFSSDFSFFVYHPATGNVEFSRVL